MGAALLVASTNAQQQLRRKLQGGAPGVGELECGDHPTDPDAQLCSFGLPKVLGANGNQPVPTYCGEYSCVNIPGGISTTPLPQGGGSAACSAHSSCGSLQGDCCPTTNGGYLDCCDQGRQPVPAPVPAPPPVPFIAQNDGITNSNTPGTPGSLAGGGQTVTTTDGQGVQATFAVNPEGLCISNGIGGTCTNSAFPSIACCTDSVTGAFFNGCCVQGFSGMILGDQDNDGNPNEFDVIIAPTDQYGLADCVALDNQQGCSVLSTPNQAPASLPGNACTRVAQGMSNNCAAFGQQYGGTCENSGGGGVFDVCCSNCGTGTYQVGDSCDVTVPPSCLNPDGTLIAGGGSSSSAAGVGSTPNNGPSSNQAGTVSMGRACQADADCHAPTAFCISNRNVCASKGSCQTDADCTNPNNQTPFACANGTTLKSTSGGVSCDQICESSSAGTPDSNADPTSGCITDNSTGKPCVPEFTGQINGAGLPVSAAAADGTNCCQFLPRTQGGVADEASFIRGVMQCDCPGQLNDAGQSYCETIGWNCRNLNQLLGN